jgi:hypothetical protein
MYGTAVDIQNDIRTVHPELMDHFLLSNPNFTLFASFNRSSVRMENICGHNNSERSVSSRCQIAVDCYLCSHFWFATVQLVLHADWQDVWHSPQPDLARSFLETGALMVFMCFICDPPDM